MKRQQEGFECGVRNDRGSYISYNVTWLHEGAVTKRGKTEGKLHELHGYMKSVHAFAARFVEY